MNDNDVGEENDAIYNVDDLTKGDLYHRKLIAKCLKRKKKRKR